MRSKRCRIPAAIDREGRRARGRGAIGSDAAAASDSCRRAFHRPIRAHARQAQSTAFGALPTLPCRVTTTKFGRSWSLSHLPLRIVSRQLSLSIRPWLRQTLASIQATAARIDIQLIHDHPDRSRRPHIAPSLPTRSTAEGSRAAPHRGHPSTICTHLPAFTHPAFLRDRSWR